jgi:aminomethyltransferase
MAAQQSPLYSEHLGLGARMIEFGGWEMPVYYTSITDEHTAVRERVGVFDISHMGEIEVRGGQASAWLNRLLTNNVQRLAVGEGQYTLLLNPAGGVIDDLIIYRLGEDHFFLVVNAAKTAEVLAWLYSHLEPGIEAVNSSDRFAALAVQGPLALQLLKSNDLIPSHNRIVHFPFAGTNALVARTGYTGEDGFEIFFPVVAAQAVWRALLAQGRPFGIRPCGLGARDTLRLEACYPLNGADLGPEKTPLEAGLAPFVDLTKAEFVGRAKLQQQKEEGVPTRLMPLKLGLKSAPPRAHYPVLVNGKRITELTSGTLSPTLGIGIALAYLPAAYAQMGREVEIDVRGRRFPATVSKKPLYKRAC